ncbi:MAG: GNAT family N-acetyltransferase [Anaerolineae bacterium]
MRLGLGGLWRFQPDPAGYGADLGYGELDCDDRRWREVRVPVDFETCHPALEAYEGAGWFRRWVTVPDDWRGRRVVLHFEGVNTHARVWVNGYAVGTCEDPFLPFEFDVHDVLAFGRSNLIAVRIDNERRPGEVPGLERGWRNFGGFLREAWMTATGLCHIERVSTVAEPNEGGGHLAVEAWIRNASEEGARVALAVEVGDAGVGEGGQVLASQTSAEHLIPVGETVPIGVSLDVSGVLPWSPSSPQLYTVRLTLEGDAAGDTRTFRVGFRTIEARAGSLWLNGEPIFLTGFNRHEDSPTRNMCPDLDLAREDLAAMKAAGANFVRLCHYPHHPGEVALCDELGLLVMDEIPLYWWSGAGEGEELVGEKLAGQKLGAAKRQLEKLIWRDRTHPSVIFWSVSNETEEARPEVAAGNRELVQLAKALDPTRLAVHVSNHWRAQPKFDADDVICVNAYPSIPARWSDGELAHDLAGSTRFWRDGLAELHLIYPEKPILVTEFGATSFYDVTDGIFGGEHHAEVIERAFAGMDAPYVAGATLWCWADHAWPPATFAFCNYLAVSPYGVLTRDRRRKAPYWTARRLFQERQGVQPGDRAGHTTAPGPAGREIYMVRPNLDDIPHVALPEGFRIRAMRPDEGALWTDIWRDADPYASVDQGMFDREFGYDRQALAWRGFMVENEKGVAVATITAWYNRTYQGDDYGQVHWVAVREAYRGRGIGKAMLSYVLARMAQWHDKAFLGTQTKRLPAIKLYLDFGFVPDLRYEGARTAWQEVRADLDHPVLEALDL